MRAIVVGGLVALIVMGDEPGSPLAVGLPELAALRTKFAQLYNRGDTIGLRELYTADAVRMPYDAPSVRGQSEIVEAFGSAFAKRQMTPTLVLDAEEVAVVQGQAVERGRYHEELRPRTGGAGVTEDGKYVAVLTRDVGGVWRYKWSIFNRDQAPKR